MQPVFSVRIVHISLEIWGAVFELIMVACMYLGKNFPEKKRRILMLLYASVAALLGNDALAWLFRGMEGRAGYWMVRISNFLVFLLSDELLLVYHRYLCSYLPEKGQKNFSRRIRLVYGIGIAAMVLVCVSQFTGLYYYFDAGNSYHRSRMYPVSALLPLMGMLLDLSILLQCRKIFRREIFWSMVSYIVLPFIGTVLLIFYYGISLVNISICISSVFLFLAAIMEQNRIMEEKEKEAYDLRVTILLSQIRPHFIYNTLTTIKYLCKKNPDQASDTIDEFSRYLRGSLDSLMDKRPVSFRKELDHVKNYLAIEQRRFGGRVKVVYDIQEEYFLMPSLILQPVVENAVKHGITPKEQGGTIWIKSGKEGSSYYITVADDGVGYEEEKWKTDGKVHIGIENTRSRLKSMCGGELQITGGPGRGTCVVIRIPGEGQTRK